METQKIGDVFLYKRYFNSKRISFVPCELISFGDNPTSPVYLTLKDLQRGDIFKTSRISPFQIKPISKSWVENMIKRLTSEKTVIENQILNLNKLQKL